MSAGLALSHAAVWMEQYGKMYVHGGVPTHHSYASMYDPVADDWDASVNIASTADFPTVRRSGPEPRHWSGSESAGGMILFQTR